MSFKDLFCPSSLLLNVEEESFVEQNSNDTNILQNSNNHNNIISNAFENDHSLKTITPKKILKRNSDSRRVPSIHSPNSMNSFPLSNDQNGNSIQSISSNSCLNSTFNNETEINRKEEEYKKARDRIFKDFDSQNLENNDSIYLDSREPIYNPPPQLIYPSSFLMEGRGGLNILNIDAPEFIPSNSEQIFFSRDENKEISKENDSCYYSYNQDCNYHACNCNQINENNENNYNSSHYPFQSSGMIGNNNGNNGNTDNNGNIYFSPKHILQIFNIPIDLESRRMIRDDLYQKHDANLRIHPNSKRGLLIMKSEEKAKEMLDNKCKLNNELMIELWKPDFFTEAF